MVGWYDPRVLAHSAYQVAIANIFGRHSDTRLIEALASQPQNEFDYSRRAGRLLVRLRRGHRRRLELHVRRSRMPSRARAHVEHVARGKPQSGQRAGFRWRRGLSLSLAQRIRRAHRNALHAGVRRPRASRRVRDSRQPRLVRQPGGVLAHVLPARARLRRLPHAADAQLLRAQTSRQLVAAGHRPAARRRSRRAAGAVLPESRRAHGRCRAPDLLRARAALDPRRRLSAATRATKSRRARVSSKRKCSSARRACSSPATCTSTSGTRTRKASRRSPRAAAARSCIPRMRRSRSELRNGFEQRAAYPDEKTSRRLSWRNLLFPSINPKSGWLYAFLYAMSAWLASASLEASDVIDLPTALAATLNAAIRDPLNGMWLVSIIGGFHLLHRHARPLVAHPGRRLSRAAASGGGFVVGWLALLLTVQGFDLAYGSIAQLLMSGLVTFMRGRPGGRLHPRGLSIRLDPHVRPPRQRSVLVAAHPGLQAVAAAAHRRGRRAHDLRDRHRSGATALARGATRRRSRRSRRTTRVPRAPRLIDKVELRP